MYFQGKDGNFWCVIRKLSDIGLTLFGVNFLRFPCRPFLVRYQHPRLYVFLGFGIALIQNLKDIKVFFSYSSGKQINPLHVLGTTDHFRKVAYFSTAEDVALDLNIQNHVIMSLTWHPYMNLFIQVELSTSTSTERCNILVSSESSSCNKCLIDFYLSSKKQENETCDRLNQSPKFHKFLRFD